MSRRGWTWVAVSLTVFTTLLWVPLVTWVYVETWVSWDADLVDNINDTAATTLFFAFMLTFGTVGAWFARAEAES